MHKLARDLNAWLDSRLDADDMNAVGALASVLIAEATEAQLLRALNTLTVEERLEIPSLHEPE